MEALKNMQETGKRPPTTYQRLWNQVHWPTLTQHGNNNSPKEGTSRGTGLATAAKQWATPSATDGSRSGKITENMTGQSLPQMVNTPKKWPTPKAQPSGPDFARCGRPGSGGDDLATAVARNMPTPMASDSRGSAGKGKKELPNFVKRFPTPISSCQDMGTMEMSRHSGTARKGGKKEAEYNSDNKGQLNPDWVEWLMGWPIGMSSLEPLESFEILSWESEPPHIPRVATGTKGRVARLKMIGNGQVSLCLVAAWRILTGE